MPRWAGDTAEDVQLVQGEIVTMGHSHGTAVVVSMEVIAVQEASGVAVHPAGFLLIVDDDAGIYAHTPGGKGLDCTPLEPADGSKLSGCEGIAVSGDGRSVYVVAEDSRSLLALPISVSKTAAPSLGVPRVIGKLPKIGKKQKQNKGWEGIAVRPGRFDAQGRERLVAVHEGKPRRIGIFDLDLDRGEILDLPDELEDELEDLSDVAVEPQRGSIFLLSDESSAMAEVMLVAVKGVWTLDTVRVLPLPIDKHLKPEGLSFDRSGDLWLVTEADRGLRRLRLSPARED
jgi:uncharacterized protein YjiK